MFTLRFRHVVSVFLSAFLFSLSGQAFGELSEQQKSECQKKLESILMNKKLVAKVVFPAYKDGIDLNADGTWSNKAVTREIKDHGIGIAVDEAAVVTTVKLKGKHMEIHLNGGGYGTLGDNLMSGLTKSAFQIALEKSNKSSTSHAPGGSRVNLRFSRDIVEADINVDSLSRFLSPLLDVSALKQDIAQNRIPEEFKAAAQNGQIVAGMDRQTVFAIKGEPKTKKVDLDQTPPVEKWQYEGADMKILIITFDQGKVSRVDEF